MLFDPESNLDLMIAMLGLVLGVVAVLGPALDPLVEAGRGGLALVLALAVGLPPLINMARYRRAPGGCLALPLGFVLCGAAYLLDRPPVEWALALGAPNVLFLVGDAALRPLVRKQRERAALRAVEAAAGQPDALAAFLTEASPAVRERAADLLAACPAETALPPLERAARQGPAPAREAAHRALRALGQGGGRARVVALLDALLSGEDAPTAAPAAASLAALAPERAAPSLSDPRPEVRLAGAEGLLANEGLRAAAAEAAVAVAADPAAPEALRSHAIELVADLDGALEATVRASTRAGLTRASVTPELLWLVAARGEAEDAPRVAAWVGDPDYARTHAALEATAGIVARTERLGAVAAPTAAALARGKERVREVHPAGDNTLADRLVERIDHLLAVLAEEEAPPTSEDAPVS